MCKDSTIYISTEFDAQMTELVDWRLLQVSVTIATSIMQLFVNQKRIF